METLPEAVAQSKLPPPLRGLELPFVRIHIGQYHASARREIIYTLLGSCVTVCLYDVGTRIGGMNHILMPGKACDTAIGSFDAATRYGINAMELLINRMMKLGARRERFQAKVFGGAQTLSYISDENCMGRKNVEFVFHFLQTESIRVIAKDVGGERSRRVFFDTGNGDVFLKRGRPLKLSTIILQEKRKAEQLKKTISKGGDVVLY